ncbi:MAG TPA: hypothetical protein VF720_08175 [Candidatus Eisenbacteria bacterium]
MIRRERLFQSACWLLLYVLGSVLVSHAGDPPPLDTGGSSTEPSAPAGVGGAITGSGLERGTSIMPELPAKMPEADALSEEQLDAPFAFERMKLLAGTWEGTAGKGDEVVPATIRYEVTAGGTVLVQRLFPGSEGEMMTIFNLDGNDLVLTHYDAKGNQPRMRFDAAESASNLYTFRFNGGTNLGKSTKHVHAGTIHFVNANQIKAEWAVYAGSKKVGTSVFELKRTDSATSVGSR